MIKEIHFSYEYFTDIQELEPIEVQLLKAAADARQKAYAPYSNFLVGCAILLENGEIYTGSNQENAAYPSGLCAERTAIFWVASNFPGVKIKKIMILGGPKAESSNCAPIPPCGSCRQSMLEYESLQKEDITLYFSSSDHKVYKINSIKNLLPFYFDEKLLSKS